MNRPDKSEKTTPAPTKENTADSINITTKGLVMGLSFLIFLRNLFKMNLVGGEGLELRIESQDEPSMDRWNIIEFGKPSVLGEVALARFALLTAHFERQRKQIAWRKSGLELFAEPIIAALSIGGGLAGIPFPLGDAARLAYNNVTWPMISKVPNSRQLRQLFAMVAAHERDPALKGSAYSLLSEEDLRKPRSSASLLSDAEIQTHLSHIDDADIHGMVQLARQQHWDAEITTFLNVLTGIMKVTGASESGVLKQIFNSPYFSLNGDLNLKTILAVIAGEKVMTSLSGVSLEQLSKGEGPPRAWMQYFELSVDVRAVVNTLVRLSKKTLSKRELERPFPYAPRMNEG
ncbi:MAG: hypothetical protein EXS36_14445 [Pedosphaera sp.]|nr:hypothetical protein [Pedosphaera sp.]